ncbi:MAG: helix-turn-helix transcriptional regulator [Ideonella sp.]|nr:helix-turn-helix transcriptional regulator [Ideonella sp.]
MPPTRRAADALGSGPAPDDRGAADLAIPRADACLADAAAAPAPAPDADADAGAGAGAGAADAADAAALARVVEHIGGKDFGARLLDWLAPTMRASHATAFRFDADLGARVVMTASMGGESIALQSARVYAGSGLYRLDRLQGYLRGQALPPPLGEGRGGGGLPPDAPAHPHPRPEEEGASAVSDPPAHLHRSPEHEAAGPAANSPARPRAHAASEGEGATAPPVLRLRREEITDPAYAEQLWDRFGLVDRLSTLALQDGEWTALNLYRDRRSGAFDRRALRRFTALAPLLLALLHRHLRALQPAAQVAPAARLGQEAASALLSRLPVRLSAREHEVCALTLAGHTREGIGLRLGIAPSSVATLRKRAYLKLQIHGAGELFALCLQHARDLAVRPAPPA